MQTLAPEELVRLCQRTLPDDTRAFELLVSMYKERVFATAYRLMGNRQDAEDQAQEVFLKIYSKPNGVVKIRSLCYYPDRRVGDE